MSPAGKQYHERLLDPHNYLLKGGECESSTEDLI